MINFATLQGLSIPEGVVTQITDASGRVIWAVKSGKPVILEVAKITAQTAAGETTYADEQFILLDIYPKTNGMVKVTYGGLTKTIKDTSGAESPNAIQVFFGTFNGVSDSLTTPDSGTLTIEGDYCGFGIGVYSAYANKEPSAYCECVSSVVDWGDTTIIPAYAFYQCDNISILTIPEGITSIGDYAFYSTATTQGVGVTKKVPNSVMLNADIILPSTIQSLGYNIWGYKDENNEEGFYIKTLTVLATTPPSVNGSSLSYNRQYLTTIIVPKGCGEAYKAAAGWNTAGWGNAITEAS